MSTHEHYGDAAKPQLGFFTDTSLCIGCKACEVACKEWNQVPESPQGFTGMSYDNTIDLGADTWRHVAFVEQSGPEGRPLSWVSHPGGPMPGSPRSVVVGWGGS